VPAKSRVLWFSVAALVTGQGAHAAAPAAVAEQVQQCRAIADAAQRVACYDAVFGPPVVPTESGGQPSAVSKAMPATPTPVPAAAPVTAAAAAAVAVPAASQSSSVADFGVSEQVKRRDAVESIDARVTGVRTNNAGMTVVTLDNGQVWTQSDPNDGLRVRVGDEVKIRRAALGSYKLTVPDRGGLRVTRTK
jgi:hypothetical protein